MSDIVIATRGLSRCFGDFVAVDNLSMNIPANTVHGFLGPNGSGKTTAIRMMCGLLDPSEGEVEVLGMQVPAQAAIVRRSVGYMTQRFSMYEDMTVEQNLHFLCRIHGLNASERRNRVTEVMAEYRLGDLSSRAAGPLSGGQKRRLALAGAVLTRPKLLILDEPTSEVDPNTRREMWESFFRIAATGTSILVSTHLMDEAERCHALTIMNQGRKVADGTVADLKTSLNATVVIVSGPDVASITPQFNAAEEVLAAAQSGNELRVILHNDVAQPEQFAQGVAGEQYRAALTDATIEDVFVVVTSEGERD